MLKDIGVHPKIAYTFDNIESIKQAVEIGLGIAVVPKITVSKEVQLKNLRLIGIPKNSWRYNVYVVTRKDAELSSASEAFIRFLLSKKFPQNQGSTFSD